MIWAMSILIVLCAVASLAVDMGRVYLTRTQLRSACDAAALAAGQYVLSDTAAARTAAIQVAKSNDADGKRVEIAGSDVQFVLWDTEKHTYEVLTGSNVSKANAVKVSAARTGGNAVELPFAKVIGKGSCNVSAFAIAMARPRKHVPLSASTSSRWPARRSPGSVDRDGRGSLASNGNITLGGSSVVDGDARPGVGKTVIGSNHVTGSVQPLSAALSVPRPTSATPPPSTTTPASPAT